jgi:glyoxylase-like metal-dependent hydrolase (beta-lactamase superfamily II)
MNPFTWISRRTSELSSLAIAVGMALTCVGGLAAAQAAQSTQASQALQGHVFLPLPEGARPVSEPADGYRLQRVGDHAYVVIAGFVQATFVVTATGVVLIDAPPALADKLPIAIRSVTDKPVTHVILTHDHLDHIGAAPSFKGAKLIAHQATVDLLKIYPDPKRPLPQIVFTGERKRLDIGGVRFDLIYPGANHEQGNFIVHVPQDRLVVMTDLVMPGWVPYRAWGNADHIPGILKAHDAVLALDFDTYVGGHVYRTGTRQDVIDSREFWLDLWNWTGEAMGKVPFDATVAEPGHVWAAQKVWFDRIADQVTARLVGKWGKRLGGVDTFTHDTVIAVIVSAYTDTPNFPKGALVD